MRGIDGSSRKSSVGETELEYFRIVGVWQYRYIRANALGGTGKGNPCRAWMQIAGSMQIVQIYLRCLSCLFPRYARWQTEGGREIKTVE